MGGVFFFWKKKKKKPLKGFGKGAMKPTLKQIRTSLGRGEDDLGKMAGGQS